jgi:hypothetical protein
MYVAMLNTYVVVMYNKIDTATQNKHFNPDMSFIFTSNIINRWLIFIFSEIKSKYILFDKKEQVIKAKVKDCDVRTIKSTLCTPNQYDLHYHKFRLPSIDSKDNT